MSETIKCPECGSEADRWQDPHGQGYQCTAPDCGWMGVEGEDDFGAPAPAAPAAAPGVQGFAEEVAKLGVLVETSEAGGFPVALVSLGADHTLVVANHDGTEFTWDILWEEEGVTKLTGAWKGDAADAARSTAALTEGLSGLRRL